jgi:hypothetical protein
LKYGHCPRAAHLWHACFNSCILLNKFMHHGYGREHAILPRTLHVDDRVVLSLELAYSSMLYQTEGASDHKHFAPEIRERDATRYFHPPYTVARNSYRMAACSSERHWKQLPRLVCRAMHLCPDALCVSMHVVSRCTCVPMHLCPDALVSDPGCGDSLVLVLLLVLLDFLMLPCSHMLTPSSWSSALS